MSSEVRAGPRSETADSPAQAIAAPDLASILIATLLSLSFLIPARLVFAPLGAAGVPAVVLGWGLFTLWLLALLRGRGLPAGPQPVRWALGAFLLVMLTNYAAGYLRGLPPIESRSADRTLLVMLAAVGIGLFVADGLRSRAALRRVIGLLVFFAFLQALNGFLQALLHFELYDHVSIPLLTPNQALLGSTTRGDGAVRVAGTMTHYIEFGVVMAMVAPLAVHQALFARTRPGRVYSWIAALAIIAAVPLSVSRSGVIVLVAGLLTLALAWNWHLKIIGIYLAFVGLVVYPFIAPSTAETFRSLTLDAAADPSVTGRTADYPVIFPVIAERPALGRGLGTYVPSEYTLLDNQMLLTTVTGGIIGLVGLIGLFVTAWLVARSVRRRGPDDEWRHLGQALAALVLGAFVASFLFDSLSFTVFRITLFIGIGLIGASWRLAGSRPSDPMPRYGPGDRVKAPLLPDVPTFSRGTNAAQN